ncbi:MAG: GNAT family N-acetyltransferase [Candidatus Saccharicenans sp.]|jgi:ribosomal protein S18 acetylase RimI-like enzyme|nr:GNAT family N-acetyltransferase [Candidatus Saccharicenans sp.]MDH7492823.1 GNAT family N-acetyltransferase [Candidatus Saccharicenans sp.]
MEVTIRRFRIEDYDRVIELWQACGLPLKPKGRDSREEISRQLRRPEIIFLVAEAEGRVIGTVLASYDGRKGWINRLAVDPSFRGRGLAQKLVRLAEQELEKEGLRMFAALIEADNLPSIKLFQKLGYVHHPEIKYFTRKLSPDI